MRKPNTTYCDNRPCLVVALMSKFHCVKCNPNNKIMRQDTNYCLSCI